MDPLEDDDPRHVGRFEIIARLGAGGMGRVYLARTASGERFAIKMIHQFLSDDVQFRRRFQREVMAARRVSGVNTAALVNADPDAHPPWMAVEYVDGPTLSELIDEGGPLKATSSVRLASGMAQALIDIHGAGLVHRDLKPSNVLMAADGARLIDFGIAQASGASVLTVVGSVTGSAGFMSPEQAQAEHVTEASDVFALGTVLYFAATGRRPFGEGSMISVTYRVVHADPDLSVIRDEGLRALIADCLQKDPDARPTPQEIQARCPGILDGSWRNDAWARATDHTVPVAAAAPAGSQWPTSEWPATPRTGVESPGPSPFPQSPSAGVALPDGRSPHHGRSAQDGRSAQSRADARAAQGRAVQNRGSRRRPPAWLALPVGAVLVLGAAGAVALALRSGSDDQGTDTSVSTVTEQPTHPAGTPASSDGPILIVSPSPGVTLPVRGTATASPTTRPSASATKPVATTTKGSEPGTSATAPPPVTASPSSPADPGDPDPTATETPTPTPTDPAPTASDDVPVP